MNDIFAKPRQPAPDWMDPLLKSLRERWEAEDMALLKAHHERQKEASQ